MRMDIEDDNLEDNDYSTQNFDPGCSADCKITQTSCQHEGVKKDCAQSRACVIDSIVVSFHIPFSLLQVLSAG